jgi:hypothetical protein
VDEPAQELAWTAIDDLVLPVRKLELPVVLAA